MKLAANVLLRPWQREARPASILCKGNVSAGSSSHGSQPVEWTASAIPWFSSFLVLPPPFADEKPTRA
jgi:hypothetical protein